MGGVGGVMAMVGVTAGEETAPRTRLFSLDVMGEMCGDVVEMHEL